MPAQAQAPPQSAAEHYAAQASLAQALAVQVAAAWRLLDPARLADTVPRLSAGVAALVHRYGLASSHVAGLYYEAARELAGVAGRVTVVPAQPAGLDRVTAGVQWATRDLWRPDYQDSLEPARVMVAGVAGQLALDAGRDTVIGAVHRDRQARGWARHVEPGACAFCAMLAARGAVYRSRQTAEFQAHGHCRCQPVPVFGAYEPTAQVREWQALWESSTRGKSGAAARLAFRQALEGRASKQGPARGDDTPHGG